MARTEATKDLPFFPDPAKIVPRRVPQSSKSYYERLGPVEENRSNMTNPYGSGDKRKRYAFGKESKL